MKKKYYSPEFDCVKFSFEQMLSDDVDHIRHSVPQDIGEQSGEGDF
ncbi:MAG: hypothetical protein IJ598_12940 [Ruminococcus sp.]|nr:hypothetical protein [Ruminococcus sp.]